MGDARSASAQSRCRKHHRGQKKLHQILDKRHGKAVKRAQKEEHASARYVASRAVMVDTDVLAVLGELRTCATAASSDDLARAIVHIDSVHLGTQPIKTIKAVLEGQRQARKARGRRSSSSSSDCAPAVAPPVA